MPSPLLDLSVEYKGTTAMVYCSGRIVAGSCIDLSIHVRQLLPTCKRIIIDLAEVTFVDSMGLGVLVRLNVSARQAGVQLELVNLRSQVRKLLVMTKLLPLFER